MQGVTFNSNSGGPVIEMVVAPKWHWAHRVLSISRLGLQSFTFQKTSIVTKGAASLSLYLPQLTGGIYPLDLTIVRPFMLPNVHHLEVDSQL
jgi:hypothetical protein